MSSHVEVYTVDAKYASDDRVVDERKRTFFSLLQSLGQNVTIGGSVDRCLNSIQQSFSAQSIPVAEVGERCQELWPDKDERPYLEYKDGSIRAIIPTHVTHRFRTSYLLVFLKFCIVLGLVLYFLFKYEYVSYPFPKAEL